MLSRKLPFYEIEDGIYEIDEFDCVSVFVIVGEKRALVVDTGTGIGDLKWIIEEKITDKPYDVVLTHNHGDHTGGAGVFDEVWIHAADMDWSGQAAPSVEFRKDYAGTIRRRENKNYDYDVETDIRPWEKMPKLNEMTDGQVFDLGGRRVTAYHCPGHTAGEMVFIDDLTKTLLLGDACNCNLLLGRGFGKNPRDEIRVAREGLERLISMRGQYEHFYNAHHDFRGFGQTLYAEALEDAAGCYGSLLDGTAKFVEVPDSLFLDNPPKVAAEYGKVQVSYMDGRIDEV